MIQRVTDTRYLVLIDGETYCGVYLEDISNLPGAISKEKPKKKIFFAKFLDTFVVAFDQARRMLAICGSPPVSLDVFAKDPGLMPFSLQDTPDDLQLQIYIAEDDFSGLSARGSPIKLSRWYDEIPILHAILFVTATEELCLVEVSGRTRIFSLVTEQFRYAHGTL